MIDLHTHTLFSDGVLTPAELVRRAHVAGYQAIGLSDHADLSNLEHILSNISCFAKESGIYFPLDVYVGVELTHNPAGQTGELIEKARKLGAEYVIVHGESIVEPVAQGTNLAAIESGADILAHPGLITEVEMELASKTGTFIEISTRKGHSLCNGHIVALARKFGTQLIINNDAHEPKDLITKDLRKQIALGAGMTKEEYLQAEANSHALINKILQRKQ